jgi:hypothetical protein
MVPNLVTYLNDVLLSVSSPWQFDAVCFFILARPSIKSIKFFYWIRSVILDYLQYTTWNGSNQILLRSHLRKVFFSLFCVAWRTRLYLGPLLFSAFINDICAKINYPEFILITDDLKIYRDVVFWRLSIYSSRHWFGISFTRKTHSIHSITMLVMFQFCDLTV